MALIILVLISTISFIISSLILTYEYTITPSEKYASELTIFNNNLTNL